MHGKGTLVHADGDKFEGEWAFDMANGNGIYTHTNGGKYEGKWVND